MGILSKLWKFLKKWWWLILLILIVIWIFFPVLWLALGSFFSSIWAALGPLFTAFKGLGLLKGLALGFGLLAIVDPDAAGKIITNVGEVVETTVEAAGGVLGSVLSSPIFLLGGGLLLYYLFFAKKKDDQPVYTDPPVQLQQDAGYVEPQPLTQEEMDYVPTGS